jgi:hypothetical protein
MTMISVIVRVQCIVFGARWNTIITNFMPARVMTGSELVDLEPDHRVAKSREQARHTEESECLVMLGLLGR